MKLCNLLNIEFPFEYGLLVLLKLIIIKFLSTIYCGHIYLNIFTILSILSKVVWTLSLYFPIIFSNFTIRSFLIVENQDANSIMNSSVKSFLAITTLDFELILLPILYFLFPDSKLFSDSNSHEMTAFCFGLLFKKRKNFTVLL